ncbi:MAG: 6-carboxytetrahydropterin synthase QueD [Phycisphaerae bacterium]|nr:6-carboxytetrahydropterin synthase QueD [Phycisphaerae bacterium]
MIATITKSFCFEAAHWLPQVPPEHKCRKMHGHSYRVSLALTGPVDPATGWVMDFGQVAAASDPLRAKLDHATLNDLPGLQNPTSENIARWIWDRVKPALPLLSAVIVEENPSNRCEYRGE